MTIALCQTNPIVGDLDGNAAAIAALAERAHRDGADMAVFPELSLVGYPPMDLLDRPRFLDACDAAIAALALRVPPGIAVVIGAPRRNTATAGKPIFNAAVVLAGGEVYAEVHKQLLPTYDVFDEYRYFEPAGAQDVVLWRGMRIGLHICEDMWNNREADRRPLYAPNPIDDLAAQGVDLFVNLSGSPFAAHRAAFREALIQEICDEHGVPLVFVNQVGGNTDLVFDGASGVWGPEGPVLALPRFATGYALYDTDDPARTAAAYDARPYVPHDDLADLHDALVLGIRDYVGKSGFFPSALLGLSGGIDSALTCALAVEALGPERVVGVTMPSAFSSAGSVDDSVALAANLGIRIETLPIAPAVDAFRAMLAPLFAGRAEDVTEENLQSRVRGTALMALSNKFGHLLLTTGNKSESAVGYATLYGDMNGGLGVLSDVFKTDVYRLARRINDRAGRAVIPEPTLTKAPSAELRPGQTDQQTLPPYDVLDAILRRYIEQHQDVDSIVEATGFDGALVRAILDKVDRNEFKRRQAAPGLRVSTKAFGGGRRLPIVMKWDRD